MNNKTLLICLLLLPALASAHGGRTDASGCHNDRKRGGYHCHNGGSIHKSQSLQTSNNTVNTTPVSTSPAPTKPQSSTVRAAGSQLKETNTVAVKNDLVLKVQTALNKLGYMAGQADGVLGKETIKAIKHFQVDNEMVVDGKPSYLLLDILLRKAG